MRPPAGYCSGDTNGSGIESAAPSTGGGTAIPAATSTNAEAPNMLMDALQSASVLEEHRTLMGTVVEKVQSAKSGLDEAFTSLLTGFEVCDVMSFSRFS